MKKLTKLSMLILTIIVFNAQGQDYILKLNVGINKLYCENISIKNDTISFVSYDDKLEAVTTVDEMYAIHFYYNKPDELLLLSFQIDTIVSEIDSISSREIYYRDTNRLLHSIGISDVFGILFHKNINKPQIESYYEKYIFFQKHNYNNTPRLIKKDGTEIEILELNSLVDDIIDIQIVLNETPINTYASASSINSIIYKEPVDRMQKKKYKEFILSNEDTLQEVIIDRFIDNKINYSLIGKNTNSSLSQNKESIKGIFFHDYNDSLKKHVPPVVEEPVIAKSKRKIVPPTSKFTFDVGLGFGYMLNADKLFDIPYENETYLNKLRAGVAFDADIKMFITKGFGVGVKNNHFYTSSTIEDIISENINVMFAGGTIFGNIPFLEDKGIINLDLSLGLLAKNEHLELYNQPYYLRGNTIGVYVTAGTEYFVFNNIAVGFNLGLLGGNLEKKDIRSDYNILLDKPNFLSRFDAMATIKVYL
ncbi:MAG: hypothetical protein HQ521_21610 [Bacteroidetes bacterium]|nr:hypothetical protein [Bacteroidota bacterium]